MPGCDGVDGRIACGNPVRCVPRVKEIDESRYGKPKGLICLELGNTVVVVLASYLEVQGWEILETADSDVVLATEWEQVLEQDLA